MNEMLQLIKDRRTTRSYKKNMITEEDLNKIIEAGMWAPSGHNRQPWHFTIVEDKKIMEKLNFETKEVCKDIDDPLYYGWANNNGYDAFYGAPVLVLLSYGENGFSPIDDLGAVSQNMSLAAESISIGSCWIGFINKLFESSDEKHEEYLKLLKIPNGYTLHHGMVFGYPAKDKLKSQPRKGSFNRIK